MRHHTLLPVLWVTFLNLIACQALAQPEKEMPQASTGKAVNSPEVRMTEPPKTELSQEAFRSLQSAALPPSGQPVGIEGSYDLRRGCGGAYTAFYTVPNQKLFVVEHLDGEAFMGAGGWLFVRIDALTPSPINQTYPRSHVLPFNNQGIVKDGVGTDRTLLAASVASTFYLPAGSRVGFQVFCSGTNNYQVWVRLYGYMVDLP
jgi:hypothetical protein